MLNPEIMYMSNQWARYEGLMIAAESTIDCLLDQIWKDKADFAIDLTDGMLEECEDVKDEISWQYSNAYLKVATLKMEINNLKYEITHWKES